jgi:hypothetical protein
VIRQLDHANVVMSQDGPQAIWRPLLANCCKVPIEHREDHVKMKRVRMKRNHMNILDSSGTKKRLELTGAVSVRSLTPPDKDEIWRCDTYVASFQRAWRRDSDRCGYASSGQGFAGNLFLPLPSGQGGSANYDPPSSG